MASAFFYGTLLHPEVIKRVLGNDGAHLSVAPAVLLEFTRHHIKDCDYPAIVPYSLAKTFFDRDLDRDEKSVRGTVVSGLTTEDLRLLDIFEGDEYTRKTVSVHPLGPFSPLQDSSQALIAPETHLSDLTEQIEVETYVWYDGLERLRSELWSFDVFVKEKLWRWVGSGVPHNPDYAIVDERRALSGNVETSLPPVNPEFGHALLPQFCFRKGYVNLNHGSFGALPRPVLEAARSLAFEIDSCPDEFYRKTYFRKSTGVREKLATLVGAKTDEVVMVPNTTHGINIVLKNFIWDAEDVIVGMNTTYLAVMRTMQYIHDISPHPLISIMHITFPISHELILDKFREHLRQIPRKPGKKVVAIIDGIVSNPGCVLPWEKMVEICREENVWSVVDAAHCIGQQVGINLGKVDPDFWVSNCHKWLYTQRGCAVMYVPHRNQHIIRSSFPTSFYYVSPEVKTLPDYFSVSSGDFSPSFVMQFAYNGTIDFVSYLTVDAALEFREKLGGETRINEYCHSLALKGGRTLAQLLQTNVMDEDGSLTANMVNVRLPLATPPLQNADQVRIHIEEKLLDEWNCFAAVFAHDDKWWTRCSVQVWNELEDFEYIAQAFNAICAELRNEQVA